jgi:hypothetical protein
MTCTPLQQFRPDVHPVRLMQIYRPFTMADSQLYKTTAATICMYRGYSQKVYNLWEQVHNILAQFDSLVSVCDY